MTRILALCLLSAGFAFHAPVHAQSQKLHKCVDSKGKTLYSADPGRDCKGGRSEVKAPPPASGKIPGQTVSGNQASKAQSGPTRTPAEQDKWDADETERRAKQKNRPI